MSGQIYIATKWVGKWIPCPQVNMPASRVAWGMMSRFLNGGAYSRRSWTASKQYEMTWGLKSRDEIRPIQDYADGMYGPDDLFFLNPFARDKNVLPAQWASGYLNALDGPLVAPYPDAWPPAVYGIYNDVQRPPLLPAGAGGTVGSVNGFPVYSGGVRGSHSVFVPVPLGYTFYFSCHHVTPMAADATKLAITQMVNGVNGTQTAVPIVALTAPVLNSYSYTPSAGNSGVVISNGAGVVTGDADGKSIDYTGMMAQILPNGQTPNTSQPFVSGQGHSGLQVVEPGVEYYEYSSALDRVQAKVTLAEVGSWR